MYRLLRTPAATWYGIEELRWGSGLEVTSKEKKDTSRCQQWRHGREERCLGEGTAQEKLETSWKRILVHISERLLKSQTNILIQPLFLKLSVCHPARLFMLGGIKEDLCPTLKHIKLYLSPRPHCSTRFFLFLSSCRIYIPSTSDIDLLLLEGHSAILLADILKP